MSREPQTHRFENLEDYRFSANSLDVAASDTQPLRMHYLDEGRPDGPPIVLLPGELTWSYLYRKMIPPLASVSHSHRTQSGYVQRVVPLVLSEWRRQCDDELMNAAAHKAGHRWTTRTDAPHGAHPRGNRAAATQLGAPTYSGCKGRRPQVKVAAKRRLGQAADALTQRLLGFALDGDTPDAVARARFASHWDRVGLIAPRTLDLSFGPKPWEQRALPHRHRGRRPPGGRANPKYQAPQQKR